MLIRMRMGSSAFICQRFYGSIILFSPTPYLLAAGMISSSCFCIVIMFDCIFNYPLTKSHFFCYNCFHRKGSLRYLFFVANNIISEAFPFFIFSCHKCIISYHNLLSNYHSLGFLIYYDDLQYL